MRYVHFAALGLLSLATTAVLSHYHVEETNSPLVFGPAFLGIALIISPLILGWAREPVAGTRPSGRAVLQSLLIPLVGALMTLWGILGWAGVVAPVSFDGAQQHCLTCKTTWMSRERFGPHYLQACSHCADSPKLLDELGDMYEELCRRRPKGEPLPVGYEITEVNRSDLGVELSGLRIRAENSKTCPLEFKWAQENWRLKVELAGSRPVGTAEFPLSLKMSLLDPSSAELAAVEREKTVPIEEVKR